MGIIPSFFWLIQCVSDYYREPMRAWGDETSLTRRFMREFTADMTALLKDCQSIWGWEFGNEYNLGADLPNAAENRPPLYDGSPRDASDCITLTDIESAFGEFSEIVRENDPHDRMITSGNATLRASQYNMHAYGAWIQDTEEEPSLRRKEKRRRTATWRAVWWISTCRRAFFGITTRSAASNTVSPKRAARGSFSSR